MKKVLLAAVVFLGVMSCTNAQEGNAGGTRSRTQMDLSAQIDSRVADLTERLTLTSQQVEQVRAIYEETLGSQAEGSTDQRHEAIMNLLNEAQKEIYAAYLQEREPLYQRGNAEGSSERPQMNASAIIDSRVADLTERLSLTSQQVDQVRAIYEKTMGSQAEGSSDQRHEEIMNLLNEEQKEIYAAYLQEREQRPQGRTAPANQQL